MQRNALAGPVKNLLRPAYWHVASRFPLPVRRRFLHAARLRRRGNFTKPVTFNEKVNWRVLNDRRPELIRYCDKIEMKEVVRERVPGPELRIPRTLWCGSSLADAPDLATLPPCAIKPNHGSGSVLFGPVLPEQQPKVHETVAAWDQSAPGELLGEWGYLQARPLILIEELLPGGAVPDDVKVFCFDGEPRLVTVNSGRFDDGLTATLYTPEWDLLSAEWGDAAPAPADKPERLDDLLEIARRLSAGWDFMRVDLYLVGDEIWFGEFSPYPGGGVQLYRPRSFDKELGHWWTLPSLSQVNPVRA